MNFLGAWGELLKHFLQREGAYWKGGSAKPADPPGGHALRPISWVSVGVHRCAHQSYRCGFPQKVERV